ncbi:TPA: FRG domain-containing protein [Streptococcus suis]
MSGITSEITIGSLNRFLTFILQSEKNKEPGFNYYYRGEPRYFEMRTPSLYLNRRLTLDGSEKYYKTLFNELGMSEYSDNSTLVRKLAELQHYGAKTRILDITKNPLVALYFAVTNEPFEDGYVYLFKEEILKEKYDSGHTVAIKSAINLMPKNILDKFLKIMQLALIDISEYDPELREDQIKYGDDVVFYYTSDQLIEKVGWEEMLCKDDPDNYCLCDQFGNVVFLKELFDSESDKAFWNDLESVDDHLEILTEKINNIIKTFMEVLNQRAKSNERLQFPLAIYRDLTTTQFVHASKNTDRIKQQQGMFVYPAYVCVDNLLTNLLSKFEVPSQKFFDYLKKLDVYEFLISEYESKNKIISILQQDKEEARELEEKARHYLYKKNIHASIQDMSAELSTNKKDEKGIKVIKIPKEYKRAIKKDLAIIGITDGFIFPDIEHISKALLKE